MFVMVPGSIGPKGCSYSQEEANHLISLRIINIPSVTGSTYLKTVGIKSVFSYTLEIETMSNCELLDLDTLTIVFSLNAKSENNAGIVPFYLAVSRCII